MISRVLLYNMRQTEINLQDFHAYHYFYFIVRDENWFLHINNKQKTKPHFGYYISDIRQHLLMKRTTTTIVITFKPFYLLK